MVLFAQSNVNYCNVYSWNTEDPYCVYCIHFSISVKFLSNFLLHLVSLPHLFQVGYGNAAGCTIFLTSFLGVVAFRRCVSDVALILIGMLSFASGIYVMSFVTATYMFYLGEAEQLRLRHSVWWMVTHGHLSPTKVHAMFSSCRFHLRNPVFVLLVALSVPQNQKVPHRLSHVT